MQQQNAIGTFERLVITLESDERKEMLRQLADLSEIQQEEIPSSSKANLAVSSYNMPEERHFLEQPFLIRLWFIVISFFMSSSPTKVWSNHLVNALGHDLSRQFGSYIDIRQHSYINETFIALNSLKNVQSFFLRLLSAYDSDKGGLYVILATLLMKETTERLGKLANPFDVSWNTEQKKDLRSNRLRDMDVVFQSIPDDDRARMYQSAQAIEWMRAFCALPLDRMLARFGVVDNLARSCLIESLSEEFRDLTNVLAGAKRIPLLLLEGMYLFSVQDEIGNSKFDIDEECRSFVKEATFQLVTIRQFKSAVPVADFVRYSIRDVSWHPDPVEAGEDWFQLFKSAWKRQFEEKWVEWNRLHRRAMLESRMRAYVGVQDLPELVYHPWDSMWMPLRLNRELTFRFLKGFFSVFYPAQIMKPLKILLIEGDFYRRENLAEYTDAFSALEHQAQANEMFENRLSAKGDFGEGFAFIQKEKMATVKGKARLENLMLGVESELGTMIARIQAAFRSVDMILGGVLGVVRGAPYETLVNMASIQGKHNEKYRKELAIVQEYIRTASILISEAEIVEKDNP